MLRIKEILKAKGILGKDLAEKLGTSTSAVSEIIKGRRQPRFETLREIADYLDVDIRELFVSTKESSDMSVEECFIILTNKLDTISTDLSGQISNVESDVSSVLIQLNNITDSE